MLIRNSVNGAGLYLSKYVYLLPFYGSCIICRISCQKHKFIYLRNENIIAEKLDQIEKTVPLKIVTHEYSKSVSKTNATKTVFLCVIDVTNQNV